jgi:predicted transcriptional regulator
MKTAVSIPDPLFREAEAIAARLAIPRSRLFARALEEFISNHRQDDITARLDKVHGSFAPDAVPPVAALETLREATRHDAW